MQLQKVDLEKENKRLLQELERSNRERDIAKEELASLTKGASRPALAQHTIESAELEGQHNSPPQPSRIFDFYDFI